MPLPDHLHGVKRVIEFIRRELVQNFHELADKNVCFAVLRDGCWSKLQELYIGDSRDAHLATLQKYFALGKRCVQVLWMKHLINGYGNIINSERFANFSDVNPDQFVLKRKAHARSEHINVKHHFVFNLLEEKLAIFRHKTSANQLVDVFRKPLDFNSLLYVRKALGIKFL